ncbi:hypothetical protein FACS189445_2490 [Spirochaetia bacterium]|nr:hypothetical protein FACS189445_2490 [Spirochaetia bacterium]
MENMKSKVMTLGNKLAPKVGNRHEAFVQAWLIVKAQGLEVKAAGVSFGRSPVASVLRGLPAVRVVGDDVKGLRLRFTV